MKQKREVAVKTNFAQWPIYEAGRSDAWLPVSGNFNIPCLEWIRPFIIYLFSLLLIFLLLFPVVLSWPKIENMFCEWKFCTASALLWQPTFDAKCRKMDLRFRQLTNSSNDSRFGGSNSGEKKSNAWVNAKFCLQVEPGDLNQFDVIK